MATAMAEISISPTKKGDVEVALSESLEFEVTMLRIAVPDDGAPRELDGPESIEVKGNAKVRSLDPLDLVSLVSVSDGLEVELVGSRETAVRRVTVNAERLASAAYKRAMVSTSSGEGARYTRRVRLESLEALDTKALVAKYPGVLDTLAKAALARGDCTLAKERWSRLERVVPAFHARCRLGLAEAEILSGNFDRAEALLDGLKFKRPNARVEKAWKKLSGEGRLEAAQKTWFDARRAIFAARYGDFRKYGREALSLLGFAGEELQSLDSVLEALGSLVAGKRVEVSRNGRKRHECQSPENNGPKWIFCAGFGWSGSGAVFDFLRQYDRDCYAIQYEVSLIANRYLTPGGIARMDWTEESEIKKSVFQYVESAVFGFGSTVGKAEHLRALHRRSLLGVAAAQGLHVRSMVDYAADFVNGVTSDEARRVPASKAIRNELQHFIRRTLDHLSSVSGGRKLIFSNAVHAYRLHLLEFLGPEAVVVPVFRDPRDQYVDRAVIKKRESLLSFIVFTAGRYHRYERMLKDSDLAKAVFPVRFEEFVLNPGVREQLCHRVGVKGEPSKAPTSFDPAVSAENVGIYKQYPKRPGIRMIERAFPEYLYPPRAPQVHARILVAFCSLVTKIFRR